MLRKVSVAPRAMLSHLWGSACAAILAAPWFAAHGDASAAALLYTLFSPVCHQDPARSFEFCARPVAVCHRCAGIYLALFLVSLWPFELDFLLRVPRRRRLWVVVATVPLLVDVIGPFAGFWVNTPASRFLTGLFFGSMLASLLAPGVEEFLCEVRSKVRGIECDAAGGRL